MCGIVFPESAPRLCGRGRTHPRLGFVILAVLCVVGAYAWAGDGTLRKVTLVTQWKPQAESAGFYMAKEKGFYEEHGLDLTILWGGPGRSPIEMLKQGQADFITMFLSNAIKERAANGVALRNIAQLSQQSEQVLVARKSSGIRGPQDLEGKRVSLWPNFRVRPLALFRKFNVNVHIVPQSATVNLFLHNGVDVASAMMFDEYHLLLQAGLDKEDLVVIPFDQYGLGFPEDGIYCLDATIKKDPDLCRRFVQATIKGWLYAFDHFGETLDVTLRYAREAHTGTSRAHQRWMLEQMRDIVKPPEPGDAIGRLQAADYDQAVRELKEAKVIESAPTLGDFYVPCMEERR